MYIFILYNYYTTILYTILYTLTWTQEGVDVHRPSIVYDLGGAVDRVIAYSVYISEVYVYGVYKNAYT